MIRRTEVVPLRNAFKAGKNLTNDGTVSAFGSRDKTSINRKTIPEMEKIKRR